MNLTDQVNAGIKQAMLAKDEASLRGLRAIKSALILLKTEKGPSVEITSEDEIKMLQKLVKQRKESVDIYNSQGREDLARSESEEISVIERFLPAQMSELDIRKELAEIIKNAGAENATHLGKVMGLASKHFAGKADNKVVAALVKEMLS
jgi:uncharacterized protein YqeY